MWIHWVLYYLHLITTQIRPGFHIYTLERSFCLILYIIIVIRHIPRCVIRHLLHFGLSYICIYQPILLHPNTLRFLYRMGVVETRVPGGASSIPRAHTRMSWQLTSPHIYSGPEYHTDTNNKAGNLSMLGMSHMYATRTDWWSWCWDMLESVSPKSPRWCRF